MINHRHFCIEFEWDFLRSLCDISAYVVSCMGLTDGLFRRNSENAFATYSKLMFLKVSSFSRIQLSSLMQSFIF